MFLVYFELVRKFFRQVCVIVCALVFCACIIQSSKYMHFVSESHATVSQVFKCVSLLAVDVFANVLPISLGIAISFILFNFKRTNQMLTIQSFGRSRCCLAFPVIITAVCATLFMYSITLYFSPASLQNFKLYQVQLVNNISFPKHSGNLLNYKGISVFAKRHIGNLNFEKLVIVDTNNESVTRTYSADKGGLVRSIIRLKNGVITELDRRNDKVSVLKFDEHAYDLNETMTKLQLNLSPHEMSTYDLWNTQDQRCIAERHNRLIMPILCIIIALISLLCVCFNNTDGRSASMKEFIKVIGGIISIEGVILWFSNSLSRQIDLLYYFYAFIFVVIVTLTALIYWRLNR